MRVEIHLIDVKMTQNNNILEELKELNSSLAAGLSGNMYAVPAGYFDDLINQVMSRIKASETNDVAEELQILSPLLSKVSKKLPYAIPEGYFETLDTHPVSAEKELESISPFLGGLKKQMPFEVPAGYFENLSSVPVRHETKIVSITSRKWFRYAAAAMITGVIAMTALMIFGKKDMEGMTIAKFERKLKKEIKKTSDKELNEFIQYSDVNLTGDENASVNVNDDTKNYLKTVPDAELKEFLEETSSDVNSETSEMN